MTKRKLIEGLLLFAGINCILFSIAMVALVIKSWYGGPDGTVVITFNTFNERLIETIYIPICVVGGITGFVLALKRLRGTP